MRELNANVNARDAAAVATGSDDGIGERGDANFNSGSINGNNNNGGGGVARSAAQEKQAFDAYSRGDGATEHAAFAACKGELKRLKAALRGNSGAVNGVKRGIDKLAGDLSYKRDEWRSLVNDDDGGDDEDVIIDEEEYSLLRSLRAAKQEYQSLMAARKETQAELVYQRQQFVVATTTLATSFTEWHVRTHGVAVSTNLDVSGGGGGGGSGSGGGGGDGDGDEEDDGEKFDHLSRQRVTASDPTALPFFNARKQMKNIVKFKRTMTSPIKMNKPQQASH
jgi:hypothetical protein